MSEAEPRAKLPTKKQIEAFRYIEECIAKNGFSPSYREIMVAMGLTSTSPVAAHVNALIALGYLEKQDNAARSLRVVDRSGEKTADTDSVHIRWLRQQIAKREADGKLSSEAEIIKAALVVLDQTEE